MNEPIANSAVTKKPKRGRKMLYYFLFAYVAWMVIALLIQRTIIFPRHFTTPDANPGRGIPNLVIDHLEILEGEGGDTDGIETWFIPAPNATVDSPAPAVLFAHGNAELIENQQLLIAGYLNLGISIMLVEFRGYGRSPGTPTEKNLTADFTRAQQKLAANPLVDTSRIIYHGRSVGTGVACALANQTPPAALILTAPYISIRRMLANYLVFGPFVLDPFNNARTLESLNAPTLIMHGRHDQIIPQWHGKRLAELAKNPTFIDFNSGHNDIPIDQQIYWQGLRDFLIKSNVLSE